MYNLVLVLFKCDGHHRDLHRLTHSAHPRRASGIAQNAAAALTRGSDKRLADSRDLFQAFTAFGSLRDKSLLGNLWISLVFGVLAIVAIVGLIFSINRA